MSVCPHKGGTQIINIARASVQGNLSGGRVLRPTVRGILSPTAGGTQSRGCTQLGDTQSGGTQAGGGYSAGGLATQWTVCLLCSCRTTFFFYLHFALCILSFFDNNLNSDSYLSVVLKRFQSPAETC